METMVKLDYSLVEKVQKVKSPGIGEAYPEDARATWFHEGEGGRERVRNRLTMDTFDYAIKEVRDWIEP